MANVKLEITPELPDLEKIAYVAKIIKDIDVPLVLNHETYPRFIEIFDILIMVERTLWDIDKESLKSMQKVGLRELLEGYVDNSLPSVLTLLRTIAQLYDPQYFNERGAMAIVKALRQFCPSLYNLSSDLTRITRYQH